MLIKLAGSNKTFRNTNKKFKEPKSLSILSYALALATTSIILYKLVFYQF